MIIAYYACRRRQRSNLWSKILHRRALSSFASPDHELVSLLQSCKRVSEVSQIHGRILKTGLNGDSFLQSKLLSSSIKDIRYAVSIFDRIRDPSLFMYNTIIRGYSISPAPSRGLLIFNNLRARGIPLDQFSFITVLKCCHHAVGIGLGLGVHGVALRSGHGFFVDVKNALLHFYGACGRIGCAHALFDEIPERNDVVSWNTLMSAYLNASRPDAVFELFGQMGWSGLKFSASTLLCALRAVGDLQNLIGMESLHGHCIKTGLSVPPNVASALIDSYARVGSIYSGRRVFDEITTRDVALWNCLIHWHAKLGMLEESVSLLHLMDLEHVALSSSTVAGLLSSCAASGALRIGRRIHDYLEKHGSLLTDTITGTALVDMYAKCGILDEAIKVFDGIRDKDVWSWTAMILAYGNHGRARDAIELFFRMEEEGFKPNEVTLLAVLSACSHGGLVMEALSCFHKMVSMYGLSPKVEHYGCLIDLLGRAGMLMEAYHLIEGLPIKADSTAWRALLAACRVHGNVELGEQTKQILIERFEEHPTDSILLSGTYAVAGRLASDSIMEAVAEEKPNKEAGWSSIDLEFSGKYSSFC
ncbi:pentatricopeptide repeat-containing protein At1g26900, mitochondrial [Punica granatum]|uniref:Uncharacterized protein n=2 Tax=Punica granatum TaxID=22663 RepID=A0A2I0HYS4_PUNGR|nr:pentatricopeptide repeat-containing protein At1g26900, mitochondrial [Punica granatum]PKI36838.1 hypothetical protein CRG98_042787 [Punica granatum]